MAYDRRRNALEAAHARAAQLESTSPASRWEPKGGWKPDASGSKLKSSNPNPSQTWEPKGGWKPDPADAKGTHVHGGMFKGAEESHHTTPSGGGPGGGESAGGNVKTGPRGGQYIEHPGGSRTYIK